MCWVLLWLVSAMQLQILALWVIASSFCAWHLFHALTSAAVRVLELSTDLSMYLEGSKEQVVLLNMPPAINMTAAATTSMKNSNFSASEFGFGTGRFMRPVSATQRCSRGSSDLEIH